MDRAPDGHGFAHRFHRGGQFGPGPGEFLEGKAGDLGDDIVDGRLEAGGGHAGDVVVQLVQRIADGQFCGDFGDRKAGGLGGQRGRARHAGVHLDHHHAAVDGVDRPLHVGPAGFHPDLAQHGNGAVAHDLVFLVGQRQGGRDGDRVPRMDAHRIDVLDGTDDDGVIRAVADHLHLELFPAQKGFIDQDLRHGRGIKARAADALIVVAVIGHAAAGAAQRIGGADDGGQADVIDGRYRRLHARIDVELAVRQPGRGNDGGFGVFQPDAVHRLPEQAAVFGHFDGAPVGPDQLDPESLQHAHVGQGQRGVQPGLPAHCRQQRVRAFLFDDPGDDFGGDRLDIGGVGQAGVGHDRSGVGIDQDHPVAFFAQGLAGLGAGIVEFAGLPDDDGTGADDHDRRDVGSLRHVRPPMRKLTGL